MFKRLPHLRSAAAMVFLAVSRVAVAEDVLATQRKHFDSNASADFCRAGAGIKVVDTAAPLDEAFLKTVRRFGVTTVARYYGYTDQAPPPGGGKVGAFETAKVVSAADIALLRRMGMTSIAVFQFHSSRESTFANWKVRGPADGQRAVQLARDLGQPVGTTIFFGADGDFVTTLNRPCKPFKSGRTVSAGQCSGEIAAYFSAVSAELKKTGYAVGVYGSGAACELLTGKGLVEKCWLNSSPGHAGRTFGLNSRHTVMVQLKEAKAGDAAACGRPIDVNRITTSDFGQFAYE